MPMQSPPCGSPNASPAPRASPSPPRASPSPQRPQRHHGKRPGRSPLPVGAGNLQYDLPSESAASPTSRDYATCDERLTDDVYDDEQLLDARALLSPEPDEYPLCRYRHAVLFSVFLLNLMNAALWLTYSPISDLVSTKYDVAESVVNVLSLCLSGLYGPVVFGAAPMVRKVGLAHSVRIAAALSAIGAIVRALGRSPSTFWLLVLGQCLSGMARPVISQLLGLTSLNWFHKDQRQLATAVAALGNPFGVALGFMLSPLITDKDPDNVVRLNYYTAIGSVALAVVVCVLVRERPAEDPSAAARDARKRGHLAEPFSAEAKRLCRSQYWLLSGLFGMAFGQCNAVAVILNQMLKPFGYHHAAVGTTGVMTIVPGVVGALLISKFLGARIRKYSEQRMNGENPTYGFLYRETLSAIYLMGGSFMVCIVWLAERNGLAQFNPYLLGSAALFGFFAQPAFAVGLEAAAETVYPASPSTAGAGVTMCAQYVGLVVSAGCGYYIDQAGSDSLKRDRVHEVGMGMSSCWILSGLLTLLFFKGRENLRRLTYEHEEETRSRRHAPPRPQRKMTGAGIEV